MKVDDGENAKLIEEGLFGDQLTIQRCINAAQSRKQALIKCASVRAPLAGTF